MNHNICLLSYTVKEIVRMIGKKLAYVPLSWYNYSLNVTFYMTIYVIYFICTALPLVYKRIYFWSLESFVSVEVLLVKAVLWATHCSEKLSYPTFEVLCDCLYVVDRKCFKRTLCWEINNFSDSKIIPVVDDKLRCSQTLFNVSEV